MRKKRESRLLVPEDDVREREREREGGRERCIRKSVLRQKPPAKASVQCLYSLLNCFKHRKIQNGRERERERERKK